MKLEGKKRMTLILLMFVMLVMLGGVGVWAYRTCVDKDGKYASHKNKTIKNIGDCLKILAPVADGTGKLEWLTLNDSTDVCKLDSYSVENTDTVSTANLQKILDEKFYSEMGQVQVMGLFIPHTRLIYTPKKGGEVCIVYSFANSQFQLYRNGKQIKEGLIHNSEELQSLFQSL